MMAQNGDMAHMVDSLAHGKIALKTWCKWMQMELNLPALPPTDTFLDLLEAEDILKQASFNVLCLQEVEKTDVDSMLDLMPEVLAGNFDEFKIFI